MKKLLFHAIGISMMLVSGLFATEVILRLRDEAGVKGAWDSFFEQEVPITRGTETSEITADPILGFKSLLSKLDSGYGNLDSMQAESPQSVPGVGRQKPLKQAFWGNRSLTEGGLRRAA